MEIDTDEILDARLTLGEAEDDLNVKKQAKQVYVATNEDGYDAGQNLLRHMTRSIESGASFNYKKSTRLTDRCLPARLRNYKSFKAGSQLTALMRQVSKSCGIFRSNISQLL